MQRGALAIVIDGPRVQRRRACVAAACIPAFWAPLPSAETSYSSFFLVFVLGAALARLLRSSCSINSATTEASRHIGSASDVQRRLLSCANANDLPTPIFPMAAAGKPCYVPSIAPGAGVRALQPFARSISSRPRAPRAVTVVFWRARGSGGVPRTRTPRERQSFSLSVFQSFSLSVC